jgi:cyclopropane-fatty-acyl-phospholipid synthase
LRALAARAAITIARTLGTVLLGQIRVGSLTIHEGSRRRQFGAGAPAASIDVRSPEFWPALLRGSRGLAEAHAQGLVESPDWVALIRMAARNGDRIDRPRRLLAPVRFPIQLARSIAQPVTRQRSRRHIAAHYDLGNELFKRMLDASLMYSCALFDRPGMSLEEAQIAKLDLICEKLDLRPSDHLLEIGTGWGALAIHAARTRGCRVTTTTISRQQYEYAVEQVRRAGLSDHVTVLMEDYRDLRGRFDKLVSIEMIEAVGWRHIGRFFGQCSRLLEPDGVMLLQAITIDDRAYHVEKSSRSFIRTYIFPGGTLPSLAVISQKLMRRTDMQIVGLEDITPHYVTTLRHWRRRFNAHAEELDGLGYDERFRRIWNLYLDYCEAGFAERRISDVQLLLAKPDYRQPEALHSGARELSAADAG